MLQNKQIMQPKAQINPINLSSVYTVGYYSIE